MISIDPNGNMAAGTSTNGAQFKIPGRVGDSPLIGSGAYVDNDIGGACATGDGDLIMLYN
jgi:N4-(beta-N-acetylglucosaminyl)-L-asparaginase